MRHLTTTLATMLALVSLLAFAPAAAAYNDDPGGSVLPDCGSNEYYIVYNFDHTIWTCVQGTWYFTATW